MRPPGPISDPPDASQQRATAPPARRGFWKPAGAVFRRLGPAGPLAVLAATFPPLGGFILIGSIGRLAPWLRAHPGEGVFLYVGGFAVMAALSLLPTYACSILGGWTFGFWVGFPASMLAFCSASFLAYVISARAAGNRLVEMIREHPRWEAVRVALLGCGFWKAFWIITLVRLPPTSPFAAANFLLGATRAPLIAYLLATLVGMAPRTAAVVWAAAHASTLNLRSATDTWLYVAGLIVTVVVIVVIGHLANQAMKRVTQSSPAKPPCTTPSPS